MASKRPSISICIPTYNRTDFLLLALQSCFDQTYKDFEIIITDNSDTDDTKKTIAKIKDKRIRYYKNPKNIGSFNNLIKVTSLAKGKYIKFLLDDDLLAKDCLKKMVDVMDKNNNVGIVCSPLKIIDSAGKVIMPKFYLVKKMKDLYRYQKRSMFLPRDKVMKDYLTKIYPCCVPTGILYRKECFDRLGSFDEKFKFITDVEVCMRIATRYDFYYIDNYLSYWRYTPSSETVAILHKKGINVKIFYDLTEKYLKNNDVMSLFPSSEYQRIRKDSYFFASKRTMLNVVAGIKSRNMSIIYSTMKIISKKDPYFSNKIKLPFAIFYEVAQALIKQ
ncbi:MAG TPA: glycosyltransferase family 2 protein [Verrucomicrobiae bacterium]|nr:glycosyltransferase family 2 protein [Verrucomicrobiae bacterium]